MKVLAIIILAVLVIVFGPLATIWAINTLFPLLAIPYTIETWLAVVLVKSFLTSTIKINK